jgi:hypothetical protein
MHSPEIHWNHEIIKKIEYIRKGRKELKALKEKYANFADIAINNCETAYMLTFDVIPHLLKYREAKRTKDIDHAELQLLETKIRKSIDEEKAFLESITFEFDSTTMLRWNDEVSYYYLFRIYYEIQRISALLKELLSRLHKDYVALKLFIEDEEEF